MTIVSVEEALERSYHDSDLIEEALDWNSQGSDLIEEAIERNSYDLVFAEGGFD
jgi:hypothetical protein